MPTQVRRRTRVRDLCADLVWALITALLYLGGANAATRLLTVLDLGAVFWPSAGVTLASLLLSPRRRWPAVLVAVGLAEVLNGWLLGYPVEARLWWAAGNVVGPAVAAVLLRRLDVDLATVRGVGWFCAVGVALGPAVGGLLGAVGTVAVGAPESWGLLVVQWAVGDGLGVLTITPSAVLLLGQRHARDLLRRPQQVGAVLLVVATAAAVFLLAPHGFVWPYVMLGPMLWAATRWGVVGAATTSGLLTHAAVVATALGHGTFGAGTDTTTSLVNLQQYLAAVTVTLLVVGARSAESAAGWRQADEQRRRADSEDAMSRRLAIALGEAHAAKASLEASEARFRGLFESAKTGILLTDLEGRVAAANPAMCAMLGRAAEDVVGADLIALTHPDQRTASRVRLAALIGGRLPMYRVRTRYLHADGSAVDADIAVTLVTDEDGAPVHTVATVDDVTDRLRAEEQLTHLEAQLQRSQRLESLGTLAGGIAHDLNNVLTPMMVATDMLLPAEEDPTRRQLLDLIAANTRRGADVVRQILAFARGVDGERAVVDVASLVQGVARIAEDTFLKAVRVEVLVDTPLPPVEGDPTQLHQVLLNLCVNARDAMPDGGVLRLAARQVEVDERSAALHPGAGAGAHVVIEVTDDGEGMPPEVVDRIFEPFFTTKPVGSGTGLGLSTSAGIIRSHGGFIDVRSAPGEGSSFQVHLPATSPVGEVEPPGLTPLPRGEGRIALVVDDERAVRQTVRGTLESYGYQVHAAADGAGAVALLSSGAVDPDVVVTDLMMPGLDGASTIAALRALRPDLPVVASSGLLERLGPDRLEGLDVVHLHKPFSVEALLRAVDAAITSDRTGSHLADSARS